MRQRHVDGYGIAVIAAGSATSPALQHLVIEGNTVTRTRTGQSETVTINGASPTSSPPAT